MEAQPCVRVWQLGYNLHLKLKLPSSGVIIDFLLTGIRTLWSSALGRQGRQAPKILGKLGPENFLTACRGYPDLTSNTDSGRYRCTILNEGLL